MVASPYARCKIGTKPRPGQLELTPRVHYEQARVECIRPGFKTHGQSQPKSETESTSGSTKGDFVTANKFLKKSWCKKHNACRMYVSPMELQGFSNETKGRNTSFLGLVTLFSFFHLLAIWVQNDTDTYSNSTQTQI